MHGCRLELVSHDDDYETECSATNTWRLLEQDKVFALLGYYGSSPTTTAMAVFSAAKTPWIGTISCADSLRSPVNRCMFHVRVSHAGENAAIVDQLVSLGISSIQVFYQDNGFELSGWKA